MTYISIFFFGVAMLSLLGAAAFSIRDSVIWLQTGHWLPITNADAVSYLGLEYLGVSWAEADHWIRLFLEYPLSIGCFAVWFACLILSLIVMAIASALNIR